MSLLTEVHTPPMSLDPFRGVAERRQFERAAVVSATLRERLSGRVVWNVSSTAAGGGVAEMLHRLIGYARGLGFDARWLVLQGDPSFFRVTKRLHNALHGERGDGSPLGEAAHDAYQRTLRANAAELSELVQPGDIVLLHDPQTAGLVPELLRRTPALVWRCHVGNGGPDVPDEIAAWEFLRPYLEKVRRAVFTRQQYVPDYLAGKAVVITPNVDPFSAKNAPMTTATVRAILGHIGVTGETGGRGRRVFRRGDGSVTRVERRATIVREGEAPSVDTPLVVQVSRWDRLKDPSGVLRGFARFVAQEGCPPAELMLVGPESAAVADDPEGAEVFREIVVGWQKLPEAVRRRVHLVSLPMDDIEENAAMVNAIQRHAAVVVQKSLREGFGLTVTEAMWKAKPVIGSLVGGIQDQIEDGRTGRLVDPEDEEAFVSALASLLADPVAAARMGRRAKARVRREYLGITSLLNWGALLGSLLDDL